MEMPMEFAPDMLLTPAEIARLRAASKPWSLARKALEGATARGGAATKRLDAELAGLQAEVRRHQDAARATGGSGASC